MASRKRPAPPQKPSLDIGSGVAAFSEEQVERVTGLSKSRLRYWEKTDFFKPSYVGDDPRLPFNRFYSFKDIVALRTLEMLRVQENVPLQHLRKVADKLSHLKDELWTKTTLFVINRRVVIVNPETKAPQEVVSGQHLLPIPLKEVMDDTSAGIVRLTSRSRAAFGRIARSRRVNRNAWVVEGTRIPVAAVQRLYEDGFDIKAIIEEYPDLTVEDVEAALRHEDHRAA